jgi:hypothetical protein
VYLAGRRWGREGRPISSPLGEINLGMELRLWVTAMDEMASGLLLGVTSLGGGRVVLVS